MKKILLFFITILLIVKATCQDATIYKLPDGLSPVIDGSIDGLWYEFEEFNIDKPFMDEVPTLDKATWRAVWNETAIFIIVSVEEDYFCPAWCEPASVDWMSDNPEVYLDVNEELKDGGGPVGFPNGHYQFRPGFTEGEDQFYFIGQSWQGWDYSYAYKVDDPDYVFEYSIPWDSLTDKFGVIFDPYGGRPIGFDVCVVDRDEGESVRKRAAWMNDGKGQTSDEAWNNMDDCGVLAFTTTQPNDSVVCDIGRMAYTSFNVPVDSVTDYVWNADGGEILSSAENYAVMKWNTTGEKNISLIITKTLGDKDTFINKITVYLRFSVLLGEDFTMCKNTGFIITPAIENGIKPFDFFWNSQPGDSVFPGSFTESGNIGLKIKDNVGCIATDNIFITVPQSCYRDQICMVTVDAVTVKNKVVWQKTGGMIIKEYQILKESTVAGQYTVIGTVPFINESVFIDNTSEPARHSDRYRMVSIDSCGNTSTYSSDHQTIHLLLSPGLPGKFNLSWSAYIGFNYSTYYIYKGSSPDNMVLIDSIAKTKTQYTDTASGVAYYQIAVRRDQPCDISALKSSGDLYSEAFSNMENTLSSYINNEEQLKYYFNIEPNPFDNELVIEYSLFKPSEVNIAIYNILGMKIYEYQAKQNISGILRHSIPADMLKNTTDIIIIRLEINGIAFYKKAIKK